MQDSRECSRDVCGACISPIELRYSIKTQDLPPSFKIHHHLFLRKMGNLLRLNTGQAASFSHSSDLVTSIHADAFRSHRVSSAIEIKHFTSNVSRTGIEPSPSRASYKRASIQFQPLPLTLF